MEEASILEELFDRKIISILKVFFSDAGRQFYLQELSRLSKVSMASCSRILGKLSRLQIIGIVKISRFRLYKLQSNKRVEFLSKLFKKDVRVLRIFVEKASAIMGITSIILHGKESNDRANVLLIGENIDPGEVKALCAEIKDKYNFVVSPLSLTDEQYVQMSQMGLYSGQKKVLFER